MVRREDNQAIFFALFKDDELRFFRLFFILNLLDFDSHHRTPEMDFIHNSMELNGPVVCVGDSMK